MTYKELSHAELEKYHYQEVKSNSLYVLDGMMDVWREEVMMSMPGQQNTINLEKRIDKLEEVSAQPGQIARRYQYKLQQLQSGIVYLRNKILERTKEIPY